MIANIADTAKALGYKSRSTIQRLIKAGHLKPYLVAGGKGRQIMLDSNPPGVAPLRQTIQALTQIRFDSPLWQLETASEQLDTDLTRYESSLPDWNLIADLLSDYLGDSFPAPPWNGEQANTVSMMLALAFDAEAGNRNGRN